MPNIIVPLVLRNVPVPVIDPTLVIVPVFIGLVPLILSIPPALLLMEALVVEEPVPKNMVPPALLFNIPPPELEIVALLVMLPVLIAFTPATLMSALFVIVALF